MAEELGIKAAISQAVQENQGRIPRGTPAPVGPAWSFGGSPPPPAQGNGKTPAPPAVETTQTPPTAKEAPSPPPGATPRKTPANANAAPRRRRRPRGQIVPCADGTERNIAQAWAQVFAQNELLPAKDRLTDDAILQKMRELFPGREESRLFGQVGRMRATYNSGRLACQTAKPVRKSWRYDCWGGRVVALKPRGSVDHVAKGG